MKKKSFKNIIYNIVLIIILIVAFCIYRKYDYNFFSKGILEEGNTVFSRDFDIKYSKDTSYKIENNTANDAMFYKNIGVRENTPYKVSCMIKTEDVIGENNNPIAGAQICLNNTEEHSRVIQGTNDWTKIEFFFNSKCNAELEIGFRLGGNFAKASGKAWFSDLKIEEGTKNDSNTWNFGCFILDFANLEFNGENHKYIMTNQEKKLVSINMQRLKRSIKQMSKNKMNIQYEIIEIKEPLTTISYDEKNGYYISEKDVYKLIDKYQKEKEFDHIFVCTNLPLESELTHNKNICEWIGLGNMMYIGKGFSNIRIIPEQNTYSSNNTFPEEVFLHEFLHTLERNAEEYGYSRPALHDYKKYNYKDDKIEGQRKWYEDYMNCEIKTENNYIGLPQEIYKIKPINSTNFIYSNELDRLNEPKTIKEYIESIAFKIKKLFQLKKANFNVATERGE